MDKGKVLSGLAIMLGLMIMGSMLPRAVEKYRSYDRAFRSIAKNVITVYTSDVDAVLDLMGKQAELLKKAADDRRGDSECS